jgi:flavin reductase (DIM6/NTAB) family NADH-FMN oxidoreductase RutF
MADTESIKDTHSGGNKMKFQQTLEDDIAPREAFIATMRNVAAGVAVVTTDGPAGRHGAPVRTFFSVSADPPTALICLGTERRIAKVVEQNQEFCVNVLCQQQIDIANRFAGREGDHITDRFSGIECSGAPGVSPALDKATVFSCRVQKLLNAGSHLIVIGQVSAANRQARSVCVYQ